jgi:hypothetical protein
MKSDTVEKIAEYISTTIVHYITIPNTFPHYVSPQNKKPTPILNHPETDCYYYNLACKSNSKLQIGLPSFSFISAKHFLTKSWVLKMFLSPQYSAELEYSVLQNSVPTFVVTITKKAVDKLLVANGVTNTRVFKTKEIENVFYLEWNAEIRISVGENLVVYPITVTSKTFSFLSPKFYKEYVKQLKNCEKCKKNLPD